MRTARLLCVGLALAAGIVSMAAQPPAGHAAFPKADETDLDNGLHLIVLEDRRKPEISFRLLIPGAGGYYDPDDQLGLAGLTAALMRERTLTRTSSEIATQLEAMTAHLSIDADPSSPDAVISGSGPRDQATKLLDLATDLLLNPAFAEEDIERYKQDVHAVLSERREEPTFLAREMFARAVYGDHPGSRLAPTPASLERLTRESIVEFHRARYTPDHAVLAIAGDVSPFAAKFFIGQKLGGWKKSGVDAPAVAAPAPEEGPRVHIIDQPEAAQTTFVVGIQGVTRKSEDYDALRVMNRLVGGNLVAPIYRGDWYVAARVPTDEAEIALHDLLDTTRALRDASVDDATLAEAKRTMIESFAQSLESTAELAGHAVTGWRFNLPADYWDTHASRIEAIGADHVQAAAQKYLAPDRLQIVAVGDPATLTALLQKVGLR